MCGVCIVRVGDFRLTGARMGESRIFGTMGSLAFSFRPPRRALVVTDRLQLRADYGRFPGPNGSCTLRSSEVFRVSDIWANTGLTQVSRKLRVHDLRLGSIVCLQR